MFTNKLFSIDFMQQCGLSDIHTLQKHNFNSVWSDDVSGHSEDVL